MVAFREPNVLMPKRYLSLVFLDNSWIPGWVEIAL